MRFTLTPHAYVECELCEDDANKNFHCSYCGFTFQNHIAMHRHIEGCEWGDVALNLREPTVAEQSEMVVAANLSVAG